MHAHISLLHVAIQLPRTIISATSNCPAETAPTSPSPGTSWMATTPPATSVTSICITSADLHLILPMCTSLTAQQHAKVPHSGTPDRWKPLTMGPTSCGCECTDVP